MNKERDSFALLLPVLFNFLLSHSSPPCPFSNLVRDYPFTWLATAGPGLNRRQELPASSSSWLSPPPESRPCSQPERLWIRLPFSVLLYLIMCLHSGFLNTDILPLSFVTLFHLILIDFTKIQFLKFFIWFCCTADFLKQTPNIERQYFPEVGWKHSASYTQ